MADHLPFIRAIAENDEGDPGPYLIYADFLDERDDPRGELIRVQIALESMRETDAARVELKTREGELIQACLPTWKQQLKHLGGGIELKRGLPEAITMEAKVFLARGPELFDLAPIRHVRFLDVGNRLPAILAHPATQMLRAITVFAQYLGERIPTAFLGAPVLPHLRSLHMGRNRLGDAGLETLSRTRNLPGLGHLELADNQIGDPGLLALARADFPKLATIGLSDNAASPLGLEALLRSPFLRPFGSIDASRNKLGHSNTVVTESILGSLPTVEAVPAQRRLVLTYNAIAPSIARRLSNSRAFGTIRSLEIGYNRLMDEGFEFICRCPWFDGVRVLDIAHNQVTDRGIIELAAHPRRLALEWLDLDGNLATDAGVGAILHSQSLSGLRRIRIPVAALSQRMHRLFREQYPLVNGEGWFTSRHTTG